MPTALPLGLTSRSLLRTGSHRWQQERARGTTAPPPPHRTAPLHQADARGRMAHVAALLVVPGILVNEARRQRYDDVVVGGLRGLLLLLSGASLWHVYAVLPRGLCRLPVPAAANAGGGPRCTSGGGAVVGDYDICRGRTCSEAVTNCSQY